MNCRSISPAGNPCIKHRGHNTNHTSSETENDWVGGIRKDARYIHMDTGLMSNGDYESYGRYGY